MLYYVLKIVLSSIVILTVSEVAKRSTLFGALVAALPLTSLLAIIWMYAEKVETKRIARLSISIFWLVLPSLAFFLLFPSLLTRGLSFWLSLGISATTTILIYALLVWVLKVFNIAII